MHRRALLASLAAGATGLAGCTLAPGATDDARTTTDTDPTTDTASPSTETTATDDPTTTDEPTTDEPPMPDGIASVIELETGPRTYALTPTRTYTDDGAEVALWFDRTATADHPALVRGWLRNANDFENTFRVEWIPMVGRTASRTPEGYDHEARLHFAPTAANDLAEAVPDLVRTDEGYWRVADLGPWMAEAVRLAPGERVDLAYALVGEPGTPGRPTGTYEFRGDDRTARVAVWNTDSPGPEVQSRFAGHSTPAIGDDRSVAWFHDADPATRAFVRPSTERRDLDGRVEFEMVNHSHETLRCGHWNLYKLVDGEWFHVAPRIHHADCHGLAPGERERWPLRAFNADPVPCGHGHTGHDGLTQGYLGGGTYAAVAGYGYPTDASAALVDLVGDPATLVPTDDATVEREDGTAVVTTDRYGDGEHPPDVTVALTRADAADERVIAEQVMNAGGFAGGRRALRNLLAAVTPDVERVVLHTDEHAVANDLREPGATRRVSFRGQAYEIATVEAEE